MLYRTEMIEFVNYQIILKDFLNSYIKKLILFINLRLRSKHEIRKHSRRFTE